MEELKCIPRRWKELSGSNKWENLLQPLDNDLRRYLIHYGEMAQATYDNFIAEQFSKFAGGTHFSMADMFSKVGLRKGNPFHYKTVRYLYATSKIGLPRSYMVKSLAEGAWTDSTNYMGYIAVSTDEGQAALGRRDIVIAWRGTILPIEWAKDFDGPLVPATNVFKTGRLHRGFLSVYTSDNPDSQYSKISAREQVLEEVKTLIKKYGHEEISLTVTGHSLGAALATINAADLVANGYNNGTVPVTAFVFACPRVGDISFKTYFESLGNLYNLRITNKPDIVPQVPPEIVGYTEVGQELLINSNQSPFLLFPGGFALWHLLEVYLHVIAGWHGQKAEFRLEVKRDIALVNKRIDGLKEQYLVPSAWWVQQDRGMVQMSDGSWKLHDHEPN